MTEEEIDKLSLEETKANDVRLWSKEKATWHLFRFEMTYLVARGWKTLCGTSTNKYYVSPVEDDRDPATILYSNEEALAIQKEKDK
jgi:hypothetical protein